MVKISLKNDNILWTSSIVVDDNKSLRVNVIICRGNIFVSITTEEKERLISENSVNLSMKH